MNISQNSGNLEYSFSSSGERNEVNFQKLSDTLQYLDRVRSINKKVFDSKPSTQYGLISPLQKLIHSEREITYIDNERLYGIVKIESYTNLKERVKQLQEQQQTYKVNEHELNLKIVLLSKQLQTLNKNQTQMNQAIQETTKALQTERTLRLNAAQTSTEALESLRELSDQTVQDSLKYVALLTQCASLKAQNEKLQYVSSSHQMICQTQTEFYTPTIEIPSFQPNLEQILRKIRQKEGEKVSRQTLKQIVAESLDAFVKKLDNQYKLIHEQTIDLNNLRELNQSLIEENNNLKAKLDEIHVEEEKLNIFKNCMTSFLEDTSKTVSKSIEAERVHKRIYEQLTEEQRNLLVQTLPQIDVIIEEHNQNPETKQLKILQESIDSLKKENIELLKTIGEYQFKMKKIDTVLDENRKEEIADDGTVGQLVKMSKLIKESIKNLLQEI